MLDLLPGCASAARTVGAKVMMTYPTLNKALVIDPSGELRDFLRFCAGRFWPNLQIVSYLWARGCPDERYDWAGFDLVVLENRLHNRHDSGIEWLRAMKQIPAAPAIVLITGEVTQDLRTEAERLGAGAVLNKNDLSPQRFVECLARMMRSADANPLPTPTESAAPEDPPPEDPPSEDLPSEDPPPESPPHQSPATSGLWRLLPAENTAPQIPGFRILRPIATLKRGWLSLATDVHDETVALKVIRMTSDVNPGVLRRFRHEYGLLSALENVNVVRVLKWGLEEDFVYMALEHCAGGDLNERIGRGISTEDAVDYLVQIMRGLKALHARGILHRDLKPSNLLFREDGTLVLTDFGIERDLCDDPRFTSTRSLLGDLSYVSPESIRHWTVDLRSDLYSAGIVFYHMLTGTVPFKSTAVTTMLEAHLKAPIPRLPQSAAALQPLIDGLLEKNPNDRFQSAADVLDGIEWLTPASA